MKKSLRMHRTYEQNVNTLYEQSVQVSRDVYKFVTELYWDNMCNKAMKI